MKRLPKVSRLDWANVPLEPDPNFDPEHNKRVIEETIRINDAKRAELMRQFGEQIRHKSEDLTMFLRNIDQGRGNSNITQYFGKKKLAELRGEQILNELKKNITIKDKSGRMIKRSGEV